MVGSWLFSVIGMFSEPLIVLIIFFALISAVFSIGIIDMNTRPLFAIIKGLGTGYIKYTGAFLFYSIGYVGTLITFIYMPKVMINVLTAISNLIYKAIPTAMNIAPTTPFASLSYNGFSIIIQCIFGIIFFVLYLKSPVFRKKLAEIFSFVWSWSVAKGERLEREANPYGYQIKNYQRKSGDKANDLHNRMMQTGVGRKLDKKLQDYLTDKANKYLPPQLRKQLPRDGESPEDINKRSEGSKQKLTPNQARNLGRFKRINENLDNIQFARGHSNRGITDVQDAKKSIGDFQHNHTQDNFDNANERLLALRKKLIQEGASEEDIAAVDQAIDELKGSADSEHLDTSKSNDLKLHITDKDELSQPSKDINELLKNDKNASNDNKDNNSDKNGDTGKQENTSTKFSTSQKSDDNGVQPSRVDMSDFKNSQNESTKVKHESSDIQDKNNDDLNSPSLPLKKNIKTEIGEEEFRKPIQNTGEMNADNEVDKSSTVNNYVSNVKTSTNITKLVKPQQIQGLKTSLGNAATDPKIQVAINNISKSSNKFEMNQGIKDLQGQ